MTKKSGFKTRVGPATVRVEMYEQKASRLHDYGLKPATWRRAVKFLRSYGGDRALALMDERAERAMLRGDYATCVLWRDLMAAIHAIENDTPMASDRVH